MSEKFHTQKKIIRIMAGPGYNVPLANTCCKIIQTNIKSGNVHPLCPRICAN